MKKYKDREAIYDEQYSIMEKEIKNHIIENIFKKIPEDEFKPIREICNYISEQKDTLCDENQEDK